MSTTSRTTRIHPPPRRSPASAAPALVAGAVLCLAVTVIHILDQGGFTLRDPAYVGYLYWALEAAGVLTAALLATRRVALGWLLALGVAVGPLVGYLTTRSIGWPGYTDDIGNWTEPLGLVSLAVEGALLVLALSMLAARVRARRAGEPTRAAEPANVEQHQRQRVS